VQGRAADNSNNPVRSPEAPQIQVNLLQVGFDDFLAEDAKLFSALLISLVMLFNVNLTLAIPFSSREVLHIR